MQQNEMTEVNLEAERQGCAIRTMNSLLPSYKKPARFRKRYKSVVWKRKISLLYRSKNWSE